MSECFVLCLSNITITISAVFFVGAYFAYSFIYNLFVLLFVCVCITEDLNFIEGNFNNLIFFEF